MKRKNSTRIADHFNRKRAIASTKKRVLAWHDNTVALLLAAGVPAPSASPTAMFLFNDFCKNTPEPWATPAAVVWEFTKTQVKA